MAYQSLYRRYRPQKFSEIKGQDHVVRALQTAVRTGKVGHAYLLHGPRGSGKTSTARVLAKALNCTDLGDDGEPCGVCESCLSIQEGRSFDLQELDAASNNKVDDMRGVLERVNLTSPGRSKVYLLDEVHMLTAGAENALLKTLEEPPDHVTWVMATTEPHKVVHTIRSRCQVFELGLIDADVMSEHLRYVAGDAELDIDDSAIDQAVADGGGSVRDTLTALERIAAGGGTAEVHSSADAILAALAERDGAGALAAVGDSVGRGRDPRTIGEMALAGLRDAFLTAMGDPPTRMSEHERDRAADLAGRMAPAAITRALETLGRALIDMRQAPDPRIDIEVALMRLCHPDQDRSLEALAERVRQLEARMGGPGAPGSVPVPATPPAPAPPAPAHPGAGQSAAPARPAPAGSSAAPAPAHPGAGQSAAPARPAPAGSSAAPAPARPAPAGSSAAHPETQRRDGGETAPGVAARAPSSGRPADAARRALHAHRAAAAAQARMGTDAPAGPSTWPGSPGSVPGADGPAHPPDVPADPSHVPADRVGPSDVPAGRVASSDVPARPPDVLAGRVASSDVPADRVGPSDVPADRVGPSDVPVYPPDVPAHPGPPSAILSVPVSPPGGAVSRADVVPAAVSWSDLMAMRPRTPTEVVEWAGLHLGLDREHVVARAKELQPDRARRRDPAQLQALWQDLVAQAGQAVSHEDPGAVEAPPEAPPEGAEPGAPYEGSGPGAVGVGSGGRAADDETGASAQGAAMGAPAGEAEVVDGFDLADLDDLAEAPSHAHDIEQKIKATFPGAELTLLPEADDEAAGDEA